MSGGAQQPENLGLQPLHVGPSDDHPHDVELRSDDGSPPPNCESDKDVDVDSESGDESVSIVILPGKMSLIQRVVKDLPRASQSANGSKPKANAKARSSSQPQCPCLCVPGGGMVQLVPDDEVYGWSRCTCVGCGPLSSGGGQRYPCSHLFFKPLGMLHGGLRSQAFAIKFFIIRVVGGS
jgi:hypothetical protein